MATLTSNINYLTNINFQLVIPDYNNTNFFCQKMVLPGLIIGEAIVNTPMNNWRFVGDKYQYEPLIATLIVDEDMKNYLEIHNWMKDILVAGDVYPHLRQVSVILYSSHNNPIKTFVFNNAFPSSIGNIELDITQRDVTYTVSQISFAYSTFEIV